MSNIKLSGNITDRTGLFNLLFFVFLFLVVLSLFQAFVFSDRMLYGSDAIQAGVLFRSMLIDYVHEYGRAPVWNPYQFGGIPFIDGFHGDVFYPFSIIKYFVTVFRYYGWVMLLHVFFGGMTMFYCARVFGRSQMAAALAAISYMLAAYFVSQVAPGHDGKMFVTALFPLTLAFIEKGFTGRASLYFAMLGLVIGFIILSPHPQMAYYTLWACALYFLFKLVNAYRAGRTIRPLLKPTGLFTLAVIIGLAISAIHFYPGYEYVKNYSPRSDEKRGEEWARSWSLHAEEVVSMVVPEFCGVSGEEGNSYWGRNFFKDNLEYAGAVPLLVALVALIMIRSRLTWFLGGLALFALIYGLAGDTPLFYIFYYLIPNVKSTRAWSMIMFLFSFSIALLAAFGLDFVIEQSRSLKEKTKRTLAVAVFVLPAVVLLGAMAFSVAPEATAGLYKSIFYSSITPQKNVILNAHLGTIGGGFWKTFLFLAVSAGVIWLFGQKKASRFLLWLVIAAALIDAFRVDRQFIRTVNQENTFSRSAIVDYFGSLPGKFRVLNLAGGYLPTNYLPFFKIEEMTSIHGNQIRWYNALLGGTAMTNLRNLNLINMTNTRYLLISPVSPVTGDQLTGAGFQELKRFRGLQVFENPFANDRTYIVHQWVVVPNEEKLKNLVLSRSFDPHQQVALLSDPGINRQRSLDAPGSDQVLMEKYENDYIAIRATAVSDGILVLADNWFPAWKGFIDGREVPVMRVNSSFRGLVLPAGQHQVEFRYISESHLIGRLLTLGGLLLVAAMIGVGLCRRPVVQSKE